MHHVYSPLKGLNHIRLLILDPGVGIDPVRCRLSHFSLAENVSYEAVSYTWGSAEERVEILCENKSLTITVNLFAALKHLRFEDHARILWADAACINQEDEDEKSKQVALMPQIYSRAEQVLIWLGEETREVKDAFSTIKQALSLVEARGVRTWEVFRSLSDDYWDLLQALVRIDWRSVAHLSHRPWFQRLWIVQEVVLSKRAVVVCGRSLIPWNYYFEDIGKLFSVPDLRSALDQSIRRAESQLSMNWISMHTNIGTIQGLRYSVEANQVPRSILGLIEETQRFACTDYRDRIFALIGLASDCDGKLEADYTRSQEDTYKAFTLWTFQELGRLDALSFVPDRRDRAEKLPSWVPNYQNLVITLVNAGYSPPYSGEESKFFQVSRGLKANVRLSGNQDLLHVLGKVIDKIQCLTSCPQDMTDLEAERYGVGDLPYNQLCRILQIWVNECRSVADDVSSDLESLAAAMTCETVGVAGERMQSTHYKLFPAFLDYCQRLPEAAGSMTNDNDGSSIGDFIQSYNTIGTTRRVCATAHRRLGQVPRSAEIGDLICVLHGGRVPYVIRPRSDGSFTLVGESYINGVMDGEAMEMDLEMKEICLA
ncbi:hypothetical protein MMC10_004221 [Thelotrema lepadinum]|nr:hypothetical protein [Thelotrema lepadinum]